MYQALYRKYRPKTFKDVIGQDYIVKILSNQVKKGEIAHAYLFSGSRGTGKTSVARIFAKAINCEDNCDGSPCYKCNTCINLEQNNNLDILEIDAASNNRVDEIREIREKVKFLPTNGKYKVYIVDEVHMLTDSAFNALLKTLEEPPAHVVFILGTTEPHKIPQTILSRCIKFDFNLISQFELKKHLINILNAENINFEDSALDLIVSSAQGSVRDMLSITDAVISLGENIVKYDDALRILGATDNEQLFKIADAINSKNIEDAFKIVDELINRGINITVLAKDLTVHFRNLLIAKITNSNENILKLPVDNIKKLKDQSLKFSDEDLMLLMKNFSEIESELKYALSPRTLIEVAIVKAIMKEDIEKKN